jgi:curli biogenesis system outer membrane secretion channel CsgG
MPMKFSRLVFPVAFFSLAACSTWMPPYPERLEERFPLDRPIPTLTTMNPALFCLDEKIAEAKLQPLTLTAVDIGNLSGQGGITMGGKEMLVTAISKLSRTNGALRFVTYTQNEAALITLNNSHKEKTRFSSPDYFIRGGITQLNKSLWAGQAGTGLAIADQVVDDSASKTVSTVSLDMSVGEIATLASIPGLYSANSLTITTKSGGSIDFDLLVKDQGLTFRLGSSEQFSIDDAIRTLIELGTFELVGKLTGVDYQDCVQLAAASFEAEKAKPKEGDVRTSTDSLRRSLDAANKAF